MYRCASSITILGFFFFAIIILNLEFPTWALVLVSLTNDLSVMATSFDKVHSSERPNIWNMTKCLAVAFAIAAVNVGAAVLLLVLANPRGVNWWSIFGTSLEDDYLSPYPTNPEVRGSLLLQAPLRVIQVLLLLLLPNRPSGV